MQGPIRGGNLADVFRDLIHERASGLLFLKNGSLEKGIYFAQGRLANAESNLREEGLGYRLLDQGLLAPQALEAALRKVEPGRSLAEVLLADGLLTPAQLDPILKSLAEQVIIGAFDWTQGSYFFQPGEFAFKGEHDLNTPALILEGVRRMFEFEPARARLLQDARPLRPLRGSQAKLSLEPTEGFIFSRVDGTLSSADICSLSIISEEMTCRVLYGLIAAGIIDYGEVGAAARGGPAGAHPTGAPAVAPTPAPASLPSRAAPEGRAYPPPRRSETAPRVEPYRPEPDPRPGRAPAPLPRVEHFTPEPSPTAARGPAPPPSPGAEPYPPGHASSAPQAPPAVGRPDPARGQRPAWQEERLKEIDHMFETLERLNLYAVLGLGRDAPTAAIEEAHRRLVDKFHPTKNAWLTDEAERSKLVFVFAKIKAAYQTLREGKSRIEYDEQLRRLDKETAGESYMRMEFAKTDRQRALEERIKESEALFKEGRRLFEAHRLHDAHEKVAKAIEIYPEEARFFALAGKIGALNPNIRWQKEAEGHLRRAIEIDPWNADYRVALGLLYKNAGLRHKAKKEFVRALELDAANETALAEVPAAERPAKKELPSQPTLPGDDEVDWS